MHPECSVSQWRFHSGLDSGRPLGPPRDLGPERERNKGSPAVKPGTQALGSRRCEALRPAEG